VFRNNKRADAGGYHIFFLKLNMLWMAFSIFFFVKYVFVFSTTKGIFFFFFIKKTWRFGSGDWLKNQN
jgi:hypothetical protein